MKKYQIYQKVLFGILLFIFVGLFQINTIAQDHHLDNNHNGMWADSLTRITISGEIMIDSSYFDHHYYLDSNGNGAVDYHLSFGPPWYSPASGAERPNHGDHVTVYGGQYEGNNEAPMIMVYEIDGVKWREDFGPNPWSGDWIHRSSSVSTFIYCQSDSLSWMNHPGGSMMGGGMMFPDSIFCQFEEVQPDFMPMDNDSNLFAGFYMNMFEPGGKEMMGQSGSNSSMRFNQNTEYNFHYDEVMLSSLNLDDESINLKYWNSQFEQWIEVRDYHVSKESHTISFSSEDMFSYYGIFASGNILSDDGISINQLTRQIESVRNYPNPFRVETMIEFALVENQHVTMRVFDLHGREIETLINENFPAGDHLIKWNPSSTSKVLDPGHYFVKIQTSNEVQTLKITMIQ